VLNERSVPVSHCQPQIPHGLPFDIVYYDVSLEFIEVTNCPNSTAIVNIVKLHVYPVVFSVLQQSLNLLLFSKLYTFCETLVHSQYNKTSCVQSVQ
jgi:hypothetical protein